MMITGSHDPILVALSILIAAFASFTVLDLIARMRVSRGAARHAWLATAALAMGGGIWSMHFVAMLAFSMPGMEVRYGPGLTVLSLALAVGVTGAGFHVIGRSERPTAAVLLASGLFVGLGIAAMHFIGMAAMRMQADLVYAPEWVAVAILIAIAAATAALWLSLRTNSTLERIGAAIVMGIAVTGMHYVAMFGSSFRMKFGAGMDTGMNALDQAKLAAAVGAATFLILFLALVAAVFDRRYAATQLRLQDDLRHAYDRQTLMLGLVERMRVLDDPRAIMTEVAEALGRHLAVDRTGFFRMDDDLTMNFDAGASWSGGRLPHLRGAMPTALFGSQANKLMRSGKSIVFADASEDAGQAPFLQIGAVACIGTPLVRAGIWCAGFYCNDAEVRKWAVQEVRLVEDLAAQTWDAVERAEARLALKRANFELEARVEEQTRETRLIADALPVLIALVDRDLTYRFANLAYEDWLFTPAKDVIGRRIPDLLDPEQFEVRRPYLERALAGEQIAFELSWPRRDGSPRTAEIRYIPRYDKQGRVDGLHLFAVDITDRVAAGEMLRAMNVRLEAEVEARTRDLSSAEDQLRQSQKMEAVGQLTGGLAHDFNNLLTGVLGSLELLQVRVTQGRYSDIDRYITTAQGAANRAAALTHRLLAFSRRQTLDPKIVDLNRLVVQMLDLIRRTVGPSIHVEAVTTAESWLSRVDPNQLENALLNLCINARDAMPDGGRITIESANRRVDDRAAREQDMSPGQYLSLCVTDNGTGMTAEVARRAFDPFFTTKPIGEGTGLGLSMIYGFARQTGGQVRIYSEPGEGTTVCLYLPRHHAECAEDAEGQSKDRPKSVPRAEQGETVLVVDDEPTVRILVTEVLEDLGYIAIEAADGHSGLKILESDVRIDLLVSDVGLPNGMNGRQMADRGRVVRPELKVLFMTGYAENAVLGNGSLDPGMQVMTKPFTVDALANRMKEIIVSAASSKAFVDVPPPAA